jgi:hypothetical protein
MDVAGLEPQCSADASQQSGLAASIASKKAEHLTRVEFKTHIAENVIMIVAE